MPNLLEVFGEKAEKKGSFQQTLFYFLKEIPIYPFDETFEVRNAKGKLVYTVTKKGMSLALFHSLIANVSKDNKKEQEEYEESKRKG